MAAGGEYLAELGYHRSWGIGRHIQGSQIFDYWRDPDGFFVEHFTDGDMFDGSLEPGWAAFTASGLWPMGAPVTKDFLGIAPGRESLRRTALDDQPRVRAGDNEFNLASLRGARAAMLTSTATSSMTTPSSAPPTPGTSRPHRGRQDRHHRRPPPGSCSPTAPPSTRPPRQRRRAGRHASTWCRR